jgi:cytochrome o ubiquinol oxidase subunit 3
MTNNDHIQDRVTFGFWVYILSDCVLFAGLFATYAVLHNATFGGPAIADLVSLPFVLTETMILLTSSFTVGLVLLATHHSKKLLALCALVVTLLLGLSFLGMEVNEFSHLIAQGSGPQGSAFLSSFFTLVGTHGLHVFFGSLWMLVLMAHIAFKGITDGTTRKLMCLSLFWHFLDIIWIFIFTFVYLLGAL